MTRSSSNISTYSQIFVGGPPQQVAASWKKPMLIISGLTEEFLEDLEQKQLNSTTQASPAKSGTRSNPPLFPKDDTADDDAENSQSPLVTPASGRRGGRRAKGMKSVSPRKKRPTRTAAPTFPLTDVDEEVLSNRASPSGSAKNSSNKDAEQSQESDADPDISMDFEPAPEPWKPPPIPNLKKQESSFTAADATPQTGPSLPKEPSIQTPQDSSSTPIEVDLPPPLEPINDELSDTDLPPPFIVDYNEPSESDCDDAADYLVKTRFKPMTDPQAFIAALTKYAPKARSTDTLYTLALNTQRALKAWQDQYLVLDAKTAPHAHPPKKPCTGGRIPVDPAVHEDMKEADLYNYSYDAKKVPGTQDPFAQRLGRDFVGGRELRQRRARDMLGSAAPSEEEEEDEDGRPGKRRRRAVQRFDGTGTGTGTATGTDTPQRFGWGGARKRGISGVAGSETPEVEGRSKRVRTGANQLLPQRIREMRGESAVTSSGEEGSPAPQTKRRGRPPGSKNLQRRSDAGIKKGPRKGTFGRTQKVVPVTLESLSQGQNQFALEPPTTTPTSIPNPTTLPSTSTVFQAAPQPATAPAADLATGSATPAAAEQFITTTPLSQYGTSYVEDPATPAGSTSDKKRKQRVKSEKRSQSMTIWWAERKARAAEKKIAEMKASGHSINDSRAISSPSSVTFATGSPITPAYSSAPGNMGVGSGLAALPSGGGGRNPMPLLAPAPTPAHTHQRAPPVYRSAYPPPDPRTSIPRPNSGPPPTLAPAPPPPPNPNIPPPSAQRHSMPGGPQPISPYPPRGPQHPQPPPRIAPTHGPGNLYGKSPLAPAGERQGPWATEKVEQERERESAQMEEMQREYVGLRPHPNARMQ